MRTQLAHTPAYASAFCCPVCWEPLSVNSTEPWTLLRGHPLRRFNLVCLGCGYQNFYVQQESDGDESP